MEPSTVLAAILGLSAILAAGVHAYGRLHTEQQRTLQRLIDRGTPVDELQRLAGSLTRRQRDLRRGVLLVTVGLSWSGATFAMGGKAWILGIVPICLGLAYVLIWALDGRPH